MAGISDNTYLLGEAGSGGEDFNPAFRAGVTAEIANPETPLPSN